MTLPRWVLGLWVIVTQNLGLKLLSLVFSLGLFGFLHAQEERQQRTIPVGVVLRLPPESSERELMTAIPASVHVTVRGPTRAIDELYRAGLPPIEVDLRGGNRGVLNFDPKGLRVPRDVDIAIIDPPTIALEWQNVITRRIPLQASITGKPAEGYVVRGEPEVEPTHANVRGPASLVEVMQFLRLAAFDVSGLTEGAHRRRIATDPTPNRVSLLGPSQNPLVSVAIARRLSEVKFANRPIEVVGIAGGQASPRSVDVTVVGPPEIVRALRAEQVVPRVELPPRPNGERPEKHGALPGRVTVDIASAECEVQPPTVTVRW